MSKSNPRKFPLKIILTGTAILAIPVAIGIGYLLYDFVFVSPSSNYSVYTFFPLLFITAGFIIFGGYISTVKSGCHNKFFWLASAVYNLALSGLHLSLYFDFLNFGNDSPPQKFDFTVQGFFDLFFDPFLLLSLWTFFVAISSIYYFKFAVSKTNSELP